MVKLKEINYSYPLSSDKSLKNINFMASAATINVVTGASGCGKSSLGRLLCGLIPHYYKGSLTGSAEIGGIDVMESLPAKLAYVVGFLPQRAENGFFALNVREELKIIPQERGQDADSIDQAIFEVAGKLGIEPILDSNVMQLSEGQKQKVALAALLISGCKLLILDEPSANLDEQSMIELAAILKSLKEEGYCIIVLDHRLYWLKNVADFVFIMSHGSIKEHGPYALLSDEKMRDRYALRSYDFDDENRCFTQERTPTDKHGEVLNLNNIFFRYNKEKPMVLSNYSINIPHAIIALTGSNGAGKTTLARLLTGLEKPLAGEITCCGKKMGRVKLAKGASIVLQNIDHQLHYKTVMDEIRNNSKKGSTKEKQKAFLHDFRLEHLAERHPQSLSGGEKQRLAIAAAMARESRLLILDEPSSGLDRDNMHCVAQNIEKAYQNGTTVLLISHDLELLKKCAHYKIVIKNREESKE